VLGPSSFARPDSRGRLSLRVLWDSHEGEDARATSSGPLYFVHFGGLIFAGFGARGDGQAVPGVDGRDGQSQVG